MRNATQHSWQIKGFKALPAAIVVAGLEQYLGNRFNMRPDTTGSVFLGDEIGV